MEAFTTTARATMARVVAEGLGSAEERVLVERYLDKIIGDGLAFDTGHPECAGESARLVKLVRAYERRDHAFQGALNRCRVRGAHVTYVEDMDAYDLMEHHGARLKREPFEAALNKKRDEEMLVAASLVSCLNYVHGIRHNLCGAREGYGESGESDFARS